MGSPRSLNTLSACVLSWLLSCLGSASAQCYSYHEVELLQTFYIHSPNYPQYYPRDTHCTWRAVTQPGAKIRLECYDFNMPASAGCSSDHVSISQTGALFSGDTQYFCGMTTIAIESLENKMSVKLVTRGSPTRGYFSCAVTAFKDKSSFPALPMPTPKQRCDCGVRHSTKRIVGGVEAGVNEFPMMAALIDSQLRVLYCGATLISPEFVLTAAHCLRQKTPEMVAVLVGDHDITTDSDTDASELIQAGEFIPHPLYDEVTQTHDIALVRLSEPATYNDDVGSACLPFQFYDKSFATLNVIALGWGTTETLWPMSAKLRLTSLKILTDASCRASYPSDGITDMQICTFSSTSDACQFDSGGPLLYEDPKSGSLFVIGVISYGSGCGTETPNVNTRVDAYIDWIQHETQGLASYCVK